MASDKHVIWINAVSVVAAMAEKGSVGYFFAQMLIDDSVRLLHFRNAITANLNGWVWSF